MNNERINHRPSVLRRFCLLATTLVATASLQAHPGHGLLDGGPLHTVTSPYHLGALALIGAVLFAAAHLAKQPVPRRALRSIGVIAIALSAVLWGLRL